MYYPIHSNRPILYLSVPTLTQCVYNIKEKIMKQPKTIHSELYCRGTASLNESVSLDLQKADGNLKELLNDESPKDNQECGDGSSSELQPEPRS